MLNYFVISFFLCETRYYLHNYRPSIINPFTLIMIVLIFLMISSLIWSHYWTGHVCDKTQNKKYLHLRQHCLWMNISLKILNNCKREALNVVSFIWFICRQGFSCLLRKQNVSDSLYIKKKWKSTSSYVII